MSALGSTHSVTALVPGEPGILHGRAGNWRERGREYQSIHDVLVSLDVASVWTGIAATAAESGIHTAAKSWAHAADAHQKAADELDAYATILNEAQDDVRRAMATYAQGQAATTHARTVYEDQVKTQLGGLAVLDAPSEWLAEQFIDPGGTSKQHAQKILDNAVASVQTAGDMAATALGEAADAAQIVQGLLAVGGVLVEQQARNLVNSLASLGNAMLQHPDLTVDLILGSLLIDGAAGGEIGGVVLDATGVGALGGVPLNIAMVGVGAAGITATGAAGAALAADAMGDSRVEPWKNEDRGDGRNSKGQFAPGSRQAYDASKVSEQQALDGIEDDSGVDVIHNPPRASVDGVDHGRDYDGLQEQPDGTYRAIEIKSGPGAHRSPAQSAFDKLVSPENPATITLRDGTVVKVTRVDVIKVNTGKAGG